MKRKVVTNRGLTSGASPPSVEFFTINDNASVSKLTVNDAAHENSASAYAQFIVAFLSTKNGFCTGQQLVESFHRHYSHTFGPSDLRPIGKAKLPKWRNTLAWAKVILQKQGKIAVRSTTRQQNGKKQTVEYLVDCSLPFFKIIAFILEKRRKRSFVKSCRKCGRLNRLSAEGCIACRKKFPLRKLRIERIPV
jgi:hypothetical protein